MPLGTRINRLFCKWVLSDIAAKIFCKYSSTVEVVQYLVHKCNTNSVLLSVLYVCTSVSCVHFSQMSDGKIKHVEVYGIQKRYQPEKHYVSCLPFVSCWHFLTNIVDNNNNNNINSKSLDVVEKILHKTGLQNTWCHFKYLWHVDRPKDGQTDGRNDHYVSVDAASIKDLLARIEYILV